MRSAALVTRVTVALVAVALLATGCTDDPPGTPTPITAAIDDRAMPTLLLARGGTLREVRVDGTVLRTFDTGPGAVLGSPSVRVIDGRRVVFVAVEQGDSCARAIRRIDDSGTADLGITGYGPVVSRDGRALAYIATAPRRGPGPEGSCSESFAVRDLTDGSEKRWSLGPDEGVGWPAWMPDGRIAYVPLGEAPRGPLSVLAPSVAAPGALAAAATRLDSGIDAGEYVDAATEADEGLVLRVLCCKRPGEALGTSEGLGYGVLRNDGFHRIATVIPVAARVIAVDPSASFVLVVDGTGALVVREMVGRVVATAGRVEPGDGVAAAFVPA